MKRLSIEPRRLVPAPALFALLAFGVLALVGPSRAVAQGVLWDYPAPPDPYPAIIGGLPFEPGGVAQPLAVFTDPLKVHVVYFVPSDRSSRLVEISAQIRLNIEDTLAFYTSQQTAIGFGTKPLEALRDPDTSVRILEVAGQNTHAFYDGSGWASSTEAEIVQRIVSGELGLDTQHSIVVLFLEKDSTTVDGAGGLGGTRGVEGGTVWLPTTGGNFTSFDTTAHEIGHALGLAHNQNSPLFIMSYGSSPDRLSSAHGHFLHSSRYFNTFVSPSDASDTTVDALSPAPFVYDASTNSTVLTFDIADPDGISSIEFLPTAGDAFPLAGGFPEMYWNGEGLASGETQISFAMEFFADPPITDPLPLASGGDGINPIWSDAGVFKQTHRGRDTGFVHAFSLEVMDSGGVISYHSFTLIEAQTVASTLIVRSAPAAGEYATLTAAFAAAVPGDAVEIHDNGAFDHILITMDGIALRAGSGYTPSVRGITVQGSQDLVIENISIIDNQLGLHEGASVTLTSITATGITTPGTFAFGVTDSTATFDQCNASGGYGGMLIAGNSDVLLTDCTFTTSEFGVTVSGGDLYMQRGEISDITTGMGLGVTTQTGGLSSITVEDTSILRTAQHGLLLDGNAGTITGVTIDSAGWAGLAVQATAGAENMAVVSVQGGTIGSCVGDGVYCYGHRLSLTDMVISNNGSYGVYGASSPIITVQNSQMTGNTQAGISCSGGQLTVDGSQTSNNLVDGIVGSGAATVALTDVSTTDNARMGVFILDGVTLTADRLNVSGNESGLWVQNSLTAPSAVITNALIHGNVGGVVLYDADATLINSTIADNTGRGVELSQPSAAVIENSILWQNGGGDAVPFSPATVVVNSSILTSDTGLAGVGQLFVDPTFTDAAGGDYSLLLGSPAIDAGDGAVTGLPSTDFDGNPRVTGGVVDLGAFEFQVPASVDLTPLAVDVGVVEVGSASSATLTVTNNGTATLAVADITSSDSQFTASPTAFTLGAGLNQVVTVTFSPTVVGWETTTLTVTHDGTGGSTTAPASGIGSVVPPVGDLASETRLAFVSSRDGNAEIYTADIDGANATRVTTNVVADGAPDWAPDGLRIAFERDDGVVTDIFSVDADGSNEVNLTNALSGLNRFADWSPDGASIAYDGEGGSARDIFVMNADGTGQTNLTNHAAADDEGPQWSPDGSKIAFTSLRDGDKEIYVIDATGADLRRLTTDAGDDTMPSWSPDGTRIAFVSTRGGNADIYVMDADGANPAPLASLGDADLNPSWSPDGTRIAYYADSGAGVQIRTMDADGSNNVVASSFGTLDLDPDWSPFVGVAPTVSLSITSPTANQMLPLGTTSHDLSVDIVGHSSPGHWHWQLDTPLAASGAAGGEHVEAGVTTASMTGLVDAVSYTVYATLVDANHDVLATPVEDSVAFSVGVMPADYVRVVSRQGRGGSVVTIPVEIYDVTGLAITAVDLDLLYDDQVLTPTSDVGGVTAVTTAGGVVPVEWTVIQNVPTAGQLAISLAGAFDAPIPMGGLLLNIDFDVAPTATADTTPPSLIQITAARLNEGGVSVTGVDGTFTVLDVVYGDVTGDGTISAFDGSWVLEWVANDLVGSVVQFPIEISAPVWASLPLLPLAAQDVADVDDDGSTTAADATDILKKRVGLIDTFVAEGGAAAPSAEAPVIAYGLRGSATSQRPGARITVSLDTSDIDRLTAGEVVLDFDASLLRLVNTTLHAGGVKRPLKVQTERDGRVAIAFASARPLTPSDALLEVTFEARGVVSNPVESSIRATHLRLNRSLINTGYSYPFRIEPYRFALMPNYPNPFNPETWIPFELSQDGDVTVRIYGLDGDVVRTLDLGYQPMGEYRARHSAAYWDGRNDIGERVASGLYVYELTAGDRRAVRRMVISK